MNARFRFTPEAEAQFAEIIDYIAADSEDAARRVLNGIHEALGKLAEMPEIGHTREDLTERPLKFCALGVVFCSEPFVVRLRHAADLALHFQPIRLVAIRTEVHRRRHAGAGRIGERHVAQTRAALERDGLRSGGRVSHAGYAESTRR
jgi:plasmid stabilization system protein ParE